MGTAKGQASYPVACEPSIVAEEFIERSSDGTLLRKLRFALTLPVNVHVGRGWKEGARGGCEKQQAWQGHTSFCSDHVPQVALPIRSLLY